MRRKRSVKLLLVSLISLVSLLYLVIFVPPTSEFPFLGLRLRVIPLFFILFFIFNFSIFSFALKNKRIGLFLGIFFTSVLVLRHYNLDHPIFPIILAAFLFVLELFFRKRA